MDAIELTFVAGYGRFRGDVPERLRTAVKLIAGTLYEQREGDVLERQTTALPEMSQSVRRILLPFKVRPETRQAA
jgi:uncharacterized phiE125 gp8 family phage protein